MNVLLLSNFYTNMNLEAGESPAREIAQIPQIPAFHKNLKKLPGNSHPIPNLPKMEHNIWNHPILTIFIYPFT